MATDKRPSVGRGIKGVRNADPASAGRHDNDQKQVLVSAWMLLAQNIVRSLESGTASASTLNVVRQFLQQEGVNLAEIKRWASGHNGLLGFDPSHLPTFDDNDGASAATAVEPDPLKAVPPFTDTDNN